MMQTDQQFEDESKRFLGEYIETRQLPFLGEETEVRQLSTPDKSLVDARNQRWPKRWEKIVHGQPSMDVAGEERRSNYM